MRRKQSGTETIDGHQLVQSTIANLRWVTEGLAPKLAGLMRTPGGLRKRGKTASYAPCDLYDYSVFNGTARILGTLERLRFARHMIMNFPQQVRYGRMGITHDVWLEYHYSFFVISLSSLSDLALLLTNSTYRLGLRPRDCAANVIKENDWVRPTAVRRALDRLESCIRTYRELKNRQVHRGEVPDLADFTDSDSYDLLKILTLVGQHGDLSFPTNLLRAGYALEVSEMGSKLEAEIEKATAAVKELFDALLPTYHRTEQALHQNPDKNCGRMRAARAISET